MLTDPLFYLCSVPAVLLYGIAKGGFGGPIAVLSVPLMSLVMSPTLAAAILLPILVVMDGLVVKTYWGLYDRRALRLLLPGALAGIALGYYSADLVNEEMMRLMVGVISLAFGLQNLIGLKGITGVRHSALSGTIFGSVAGFTSFSIHRHSGHFFCRCQCSQAGPILFSGPARIRKSRALTGPGAACTARCPGRALASATFGGQGVLRRHQRFSGRAWRRPDLPQPQRSDTVTLSSSSRRIFCCPANRHSHASNSAGGR